MPDEYKQLIRDLFYTFMIDQDFSRIARDYKRLGIVSEDMGTDEEVGLRIQLVIAPMLGTTRNMSIGDFIVSALEMIKQYGMTTPKELVLFSKQMLYIERYIKGLAPDWQIATDLTGQEHFPEEATKQAAELGVSFPD